MTKNNKYPIESLKDVLNDTQVKSLEDLAKVFNVCKERIRQILVYHGIDQEVKNLFSYRRNPWIYNLPKISGVITFSFYNDLKKKIFQSWGLNIKLIVGRHVAQLNRGKHYNDMFQGACDDYGIDNLKITFEHVPPPPIDIRKRAEEVVCGYIEDELAYNYKHIYASTEYKKLRERNKRLRLLSKNGRKKSNQYGIYYHPYSDSWQIRPHINGQYQYLGYRKTEEDAAKVMASLIR